MTLTNAALVIIAIKVSGLKLETLKEVFIALGVDTGEFSGVDTRKIKQLLFGDWNE